MYRVDIFLTLPQTFDWYSGNAVERYSQYNRMFGPGYGVAYWALIATNILIPQVLWFKRARSSVAILWVVAIVVNIGMWLERFVIVTTSLARNFMQSRWGEYTPTRWDWGLFIGSIGLFCFLLALFVRFLPMISIFEMRTLLPEAQAHSEEHS